MNNMHFNPRITFIIFSLILFSCNSSKKVISQENEPESYFIIGSGGGFTGLYTQYKVQENGIIESYDFKNNTYHQYKTVDKEEVKDFFDQIKKLNLNDVDYHVPGNVSEYIEVLTDDQTPNRILWAYGNDLNPEIIQFYESVMLLIKDQEKN